MIVLAAHGTRDPAGPPVTQRLAELVRSAVPGVGVHVAYADVRDPDVTDVLAEHRGEPAVVVPVFLASGYHVRADIPAQIVASGHRHAVLTEALGPAPELVSVLVARLREGGYAQGDRVVLAAAGSRDHRALAQVHDAAYAAGRFLGTPVRVGYAATAQPSIADAVADVRAAAPAGSRVAVASWLLAPGLFQRRLDAAGADVVAAPLGAHPRVASLIARRYADAVAHLAA